MLTLSNGRDCVVLEHSTCMYVLRFTHVCAYISTIWVLDAEVLGRHSDGMFE